jgi:hypothetical protein
MAATYERIASTTLSTATATVTFSSISGTYTDLVLICWAKAATANEGLAMRFNSDTATNYSYVQVAGTGTVAASNEAANQTYARFGNNLQTAGTMTKADILNYSSSSAFKTILSRSGDARDGGSVAFTNMWRGTSAITSILIYPESAGNFGADSTFSLYGIKAG